MAKVSLRSYNREIGTLIDQGQIEEAVGHCNHILKTFPKHLETYQLLGKAYLEARRYKDASDVFSRLLAAVPNDFVAHVGMSMIADETERPDEAIWHMERAFESQPSNTAVQSELQRLYGRRDGVQPPKIRMTSGALAQVYVQGELYPQAIAEIMSVEAKDPGRMDMKVLLALAYYRSGQRVEASKVASDLLAKLPYCLDANRILVEILPETSRAETTQVYRHRVNALDPYAAFAKSSIFNTSDVADAAISLERLDWQPGDTVFADDGWSDGSIQTEQGTDEQPDWLKNADTGADIESTTASEPAIESANDIPDFMRAAGWATSSGTAEEPTSFFDDGTDDNEPIAQAELPAWMKNIAPDQAELEAANEEIDEMGDAMADDWINDLLGDEDDETPQDTSGSDAVPGDLGDLGTSSEEQDAALNWLESLAANQGANPEELITDPNARTEDAPEWVQKAASTVGDASGAPPQAEESGDDMAWLNDLGEEEAPAMPAAESGDDVPDWLNDMGTEEPPAPPTGSADDVPEWLRETEEAPAVPVQEIPVAADESDDDDMAWLNQLGAEEEPAQAMPAIEEDDDDMAWLNDLDGADDEKEPAAAPAMEETPAVPTESTPAIADATIGSLGTSSEEQDAALNWLESLAANQGAKPEELITDPNARTEAAPDWVQKAQDVSATSATETPAPQEKVPEAEDDLAWMNQLSDEEIPAPATDSEDETPAWLRDEEDIVPEVPATPVEEAPVVEDDDDTGWLNDLAEGADEEPIIDPMEEIPAETAIPTQPRAATVADATIGTLGTSSEEQDAAINWLESLAANQGAKPEELITDPNARTESAPDWVQKAQDVSASAPAVEEAPVPQEEAPAPIVDSADDVPEWLSEEEKIPSPAETAQEDAPATEDDLAWMNELANEEVSVPSADSVDDVPEWLRDDEEAPTPVEVVEEAPIAPPAEAAVDESAAEDDEEKWLAEQAQARLAYDAPEPVPAKPAEPPAAPSIEEEEFPSEPEPVQESDDDTPEWVKFMEEEPAPAAEDAADLPGWLADMNKETEQESKPAASSDDLPDWLKDEEPPAKVETLQPTKAEEWKPVEPPAVEEKESPTQLPDDMPPRRQIIQHTNSTMLRDTTLMSAQAAMREGNISAALAEYGKLIKKKRLLDEAIYDLREALYDYPVDISIWQMLGDAYMRAGRLQEAINAYTKAEELLR